MLIKRIEIENFKSFLNKQSISMGKKNLIIGKNGTGKSNLLAALSNIFLFSEDKNLQNNSNDEHTVVTIEIDNKEKRFMESANFTIKMVYKDSPEFFINDKQLPKEEYRGIIENAGLTKECFVMQGKINDIAMLTSKERFSLICKVAGVEKYEESKQMALKYLNNEDEDKIESLIEKIELKMKITDDYKRKAEEFDKLMKRKTEAEFELLNYELKDLNSEIDKIVVEEQNRNGEQDENLLEYEIKSCRDEITKLQEIIQSSENFINKFEPETVEQIKTKINSENPYIQKISKLQETKETVEKEMKTLKKEEENLFVELKALKFFDAMGNKKEELKDLEEKLEKKRKEITEYKKDSFNKEEYENLVGNRKNHWITEKQLNEDLKELKEKEKELENKILYTGNLSANVFESLKTQEGVLGTVFGIFDVPEIYTNAYEAVCRNSLFWTVVENDEIATKLIEKLNERTTFVALNRVNRPVIRKTECKLPKLSNQINCDKKYENLVEMLCKDYYIAETIDKALEISEKYNVNVVTLEGDLFNKNGSITGGNETANMVLRELKSCKRKIEEIQEKLKENTEKIREITEKIKFTEIDLELPNTYTSNNNENIDNKIDNINSHKAIAKYLEMKIEFTKKRKLNLPEISEIERKYNETVQRIPKIKIEFESLENQLNRATEKKNKIDEISMKIKTIQFSKEKIEIQKNKEKELVDSLYVRRSNGDLENTLNLQKKHFLIDKRTQLLNKIGVKDFRNLYIKTTRESLIETLKEINRNLKSFHGFSKQEISDDQRILLREKLLELKESKEEILNFIKLLDSKREQTFNLSFSMICDNFSYFYKFLTGKQGSIVLRTDSIDILVDSKLCDIQSLSGGQKTVIALCLIFAIQKNDPSPFYIFDEIDANLDMEYCGKLAELIRDSECQYFITSFKSEMVGAVEKCFGVAVVEKCSYISEISKEVAYELIIPH